jgi:hypothetical protein
MPHDLENTISLLARTPVALNALLRELPEIWTHRNESANTWSAFDVVGHLIHAENSDWMPRVHSILQFGETQTFPAFDRLGHLRACEGKSMPQLLDEFAHLRSQDLGLHGTHPAFGPVTLSELLATWAAHDLTHLHQIARVMAYQYREAVGPWSRYLGVLQCAGHSSAS